MTIVINTLRNHYIWQMSYDQLSSSVTLLTSDDGYDKCMRLLTVFPTFIHCSEDY